MMIYLLIAYMWGSVRGKYTRYDDLGEMVIQQGLSHMMDWTHSKFVHLLVLHFYD